MSNLKGGNGLLKMQVQVKRAVTGNVEEYTLQSVIPNETAERLKNEGWLPPDKTSELKGEA